MDLEQNIPASRQSQSYLSEIVKGHEQNKMTVAIFLDLSKAFDTLSHNVLFNKLYKYGIRGTHFRLVQKLLN